MKDSDDMTLDEIDNYVKEHRNYIESIPLDYKYKYIQQHINDIEFKDAKTLAIYIQNNIEAKHLQYKHRWRSIRHT